MSSRASWSLVLVVIALAGCVGTPQSAPSPQESVQTNDSLTIGNGTAVISTPAVSTPPVTSTPVTTTPVASTPAATPPVTSTPVETTPTPAPTPIVTPTLTPVATTPAPTPPPPTPTLPTPTPPPSTPAPTPAPTPPPPAPTPPPPAPTWPTEGSSVSYTIESGIGVPGYENDTFANATWTWHDGDWRGHCDAQSYAQVQGAQGWNDTNTTSHVDYTPANPPHWPLFDPTHPPAVDGNVTVWTLEGCEIRSEQMVFAGAFDNATWGHVYAAHDTDIAENNYSHFDSAWRTDTGLVDYWDWSRMHSFTRGELTSLT